MRAARKIKQLREKLHIAFDGQTEAVQGVPIVDLEILARASPPASSPLHISIVTENVTQLITCRRGGR